MESPLKEGTLSISTLSEGLEELGGKVKSYVGANKQTVIAGAALGTVATAGVLGTLATVKKRKTTKKKTTKKRKTTRRRTYKTKKGKRIRRTPHTAGKGRDRSTRRIRYTKKGQPYVIMKSGKARFIKKSSAKRSHKRKGGRY